MRGSAPGGQRGAERETSPGAEVAVQRLVVDAEERTAQDGREGHRIVRIGDRREQRQERRRAPRSRWNAPPPASS